MLISLGPGVLLRLEEESSGVRVAPPKHFLGLPEGWQGSPSLRRLDALNPAERPPLLFDPSAPERGLNSLRLFEMRDYVWELLYSERVDPPSVEITSSLKAPVPCPRERLAG